MVDARPTANPDELEAQARRMRAEADALERAMGQFGRTARGGTWQGQAATQFRSEAESDQRGARGSADDIRRAASAMDQGAAEIRRYLAELQRQRDAERRRRQSSNLQPH